MVRLVLIAPLFALAISISSTSTGQTKDKKSHINDIISATKAYREAADLLAKAYTEQLIEIRKAAEADKDNYTVQWADALKSFSDGSVSRFAIPSTWKPKPTEVAVLVKEWRPVAGEQVDSLLDHPPLVAAVGALTYGIGIDGDAKDSKINFGGKLTNRYIFAHASSKLKYAIPLGTKSFRAIGTVQHNNANKKVRYFVSTTGDDGKQLSSFTSEQLDSLSSGLANIKVDIPAKAKYIILEVTAQDNKSAHTIWLEPHFVR